MAKVNPREQYSEWRTFSIINTFLVATDWNHFGLIKII